jgi:hypothetical protein
MGGGAKGKGGTTAAGTFPRMENSGRMGENRVDWGAVFMDRARKESELAKRRPQVGKRGTPGNILDSEMVRARALPLARSLAPHARRGVDPTPSLSCTASSRSADPLVSTVFVPACPGRLTLRLALQESMAEAWAKKHEERKAKRRKLAGRGDPAKEEAPVAVGASA